MRPILLILMCLGWWVGVVGVCMCVREDHRDPSACHTNRCSTLLRLLGTNRKDPEDLQANGSLGGSDERRHLGFAQHLGQQSECRHVRTPHAEDHSLCQSQPASNQDPVAGKRRRQGRERQRPTEGSRRRWSKQLLLEQRQVEPAAAVVEQVSTMRVSKHLLQAGCS
jgi:hypothetical protein